METGTLLLLAGPNGAGKTTVARQLLGDFLNREFKALNADDRTLQKLKNAGNAHCINWHGLPQERIFLP